jgi:hypothetical protein
MTTAVLQRVARLSYVFAVLRTGAWPLHPAVLTRSTLSADEWLAVFRFGPA